MSIALIAKLTAKIGQAETLGSVLGELVDATRKEPGFCQYDLYRGSGDSWIVVEIWPDQAALDAHVQSAHIAAAGAKFADLLAEAPVLEHCTPQNVASLSR